MTHVEPTLPAPMPPSTIDFAAVFAAQAEQAAREAELRPANKVRLFDALTAAGISHVTVTWDSPEVEMRRLSLEDVVEQLAYDFLSHTHGGWENNNGAYGEFCFDASASCIHLEFNERFASSLLEAR